MKLTGEKVMFDPCPIRLDARRYVKAFSRSSGVRELSILLLTGITGSTAQSDGVYNTFGQRGDVVFSIMVEQVGGG